MERHIEAMMKAALKRNRPRLGLLVLIILLLASPIYAQTFQDAQNIYTDAMMKLFDVEYFGDRVYEEVISMLESAEAIYIKAGKEAEKALGATWREIGRCYQELGCYSEAEDYYICAFPGKRRGLLPQGCSRPHERALPPSRRSQGSH